MTRRRLIVLGGTGQLGRELAELAPKQGWDLTVLSRAQANFLDPRGASQALRGAGSADAVVNAVAYTAVDRAESEEAIAHTINAETPGQLAAECARTGTPFLQVSTDYVFSGDLNRPYREDDETGPKSAYGRSKLAGEQAVMAQGGQWLIARTAWVYSPYGSNFVKTMLRLGEERAELRVVDDQVGCPTAADDLASSLLTAAAAMAQDSSKGGLFHLAGQGETSWAGFADAIFAHKAARSARRPTVVPITSAEFPTPAARPANSRLNSDRFAAAFGRRARPWREALDRTLERLL